MLNFLIDQRRYSEATGMRVFKDMEMLKVILCIYHMCINHLYSVFKWVYKFGLCLFTDNSKVIEIHQVITCLILAAA